MMIISKKGEIVIITKQNPNGGPVLKGFPIEVDPDSGVLGYKVGYAGCDCGRHKTFFIRTVDVQQIVNKFGLSLDAYDKVVDSLKPKEPFIKKLGRVLTHWNKD